MFQKTYIDLNLEYLDTLKLPKPMYKEEVCEYMERVDLMMKKNKYPPELNNELFHFLTEAEVVEYLKKRFKIKVLEEGHTFRIQ